MIRLRVGFKAGSISVPLEPIFRSGPVLVDFNRVNVAPAGKVCGVIWVVSVLPPMRRHANRTFVAGQGPRSSCN